MNLDLSQFSNREAEEGVIAALLNKAELYDDISTTITPEDMFYNSNQILFQGIEYLYNKNQYDIQTLVQILERRNRLYDIGGMDYIVKLKNSIPTMNLLKFHVDTVKEQSILRQAAQISQDILFMTANKQYDNIEQYMHKVNEKMNTFNTVKTDTMVNVKNVVGKQMESIESGEVLKYPLMGLGIIDRWMNGIGLDRMIVMAGRPGTGKTALALHILRNISEQLFGPPVMFSLEMGQPELLCRMKADIGGVTFSNIMRRELDSDQLKRVREASTALQANDFYIDDTSRVDTAYISAQCRKLKREHGRLGVILIDYLGLIETHQKNNENKTDAIGRVTKWGKQFAKEIGCSIIFLHQMNREIEKRAAKRPVMSDLKDSGSIEQDADMIIFLHKDEEKSDELTSHIDFIVAKGRQTGVADFSLSFLPAIQRFGEKV